MQLKETCLHAYMCPTCRFGVGSADKTGAHLNDLIAMLHTPLSTIIYSHRDIVQQGEELCMERVCVFVAGNGSIPAKAANYRMG